MKNQIEKLAKNISGEELKITMIIYGQNGEKIIYLDKDFNANMQIVLQEDNSYKAINNPLTLKEEIFCGELSAC